VAIAAPTTPVTSGSTLSGTAGTSANTCRVTGIVTMDAAMAIETDPAGIIAEIGATIIETTIKIEAAIADRRTIECYLRAPENGAFSRPLMAGSCCRRD